MLTDTHSSVLHRRFPITKSTEICACLCVYVGIPHAKESMTITTVELTDYTYC